VTSFNRVAIIGVGLLGGSMGLALKKHRLADSICGIGRRESSLDEARRVGAVDNTTLDIASGVKGADLVIFATPVSRMRELILAVAPVLEPGQLVTDVGSTKTTIVAEAEAAFSSGVDFVGSHPMAGSEKRGPTSARDDLFEGSLCFVTQTDTTSLEAVERISEMWSALGARVRRTSPDTHDRIVAQVSHMPHLVASSLVNELDEDMLETVGPGLADLTRIASSDPDLWAEISAENSALIAQSLCNLAHTLEDIAKLLEKNDIESLRNLLQQAKIKRDNIIKCIGK